MMNSKLEASVYMDLAGNESLQEVFKGILGFAVSTNHQLPGSLFSTCGLEPDIDFIINHLKSLVLKTHTMIIVDLRKLEI